jgi:hypothetical protein
MINYLESGTGNGLANQIKEDGKKRKKKQNLSQPETEYGAEAYWDCPHSDYHLVLYLAPRNLRIKIGQNTVQQKEKKKGKEDGVSTVDFVYTAVHIEHHMSVF